MTDLAARLRIGRTIAANGAKLAARYFAERDTLLNDSKLAPLDLVTEADRAVENLLKAELTEAFPDDGFWGEETGGDPSRSLWVADPIDGTSNFVAGLPLWGTSLAYVEDEEDLAPGALNRTVKVVAVDALADVAPRIAPYKAFLQTVGIAAAPEELFRLAEILGQAGVTRISALGQMTAPEAGWHHDGRFNLLDLVTLTEIESSAEAAAESFAPYVD